MSLSILPVLADFTFGIGDIVGSIALLVSVFTFFISRHKPSKSEQIRTSRDIWEEIIEKYNDITKEEVGKAHKDKLWAALKELDYFAYFILISWIKDNEVLGYYKRQLTKLIKDMTAHYGIFDQRASWCAWYPYLDELITKWKIDVPD